MIVLKIFKNSGCLHQPFFYSFRVILIVFGISQIGMDGFRPVTAESN